MKPIAIIGFIGLIGWIAYSKYKAAYSNLRASFSNVEFKGNRLIVTLELFNPSNMVLFIPQSVLRLNHAGNKLVHFNLEQAVKIVPGANRIILSTGIQFNSLANLAQDIIINKFNGALTIDGYGTILGIDFDFSLNTSLKELTNGRL